MAKENVETKLGEKDSGGSREHSELIKKGREKFNIHF